MGSRLTIAVLISGRGTNLQALIDACAQPDFPARIGLVISNRPGAKGLERAERAGLCTVTIDHKIFPSREAFDEAIDAQLRQNDIGLVCLAGFMRIFSTPFAERWTGRIVNIHPSLLPAFPGLKPQAQALEAGVKVSGCTVHFVTPDLDAGPIIGQAVVPVLNEDDEDALAARILEAEHLLYPSCVRLIADGKVRFQDGRAVGDAKGWSEQAMLLNPSVS